MTIALLLVIGAVAVATGISEVVTQPKLVIERLEIVNRENYTCLKILFKTDKYPLDFYLTTPEGEIIDLDSAVKPERVAYLKLLGLKPYTNVYGPRTFVVVVKYLDDII